MNTVVGIDNGTQSTKVVFYDFQEKRIAASASAPHELISLSREGTDDGTREQETSWWITALKECFSAIPEEIRKSARAVGVSGTTARFRTGGVPEERSSTG